MFLFPKDNKPKKFANLKVVKNYQSSNSVGDMINDLRIPSEWKIEPTMKMKFMSSKDGGEKQSIYCKSNTIWIMIGVDADEFIWELFNLLFCKNIQRAANLCLTF